jgi:hypothetical protein
MWAGVRFGSGSKSAVATRSWARREDYDVDGVAAYLYQQLRPLWGEVLRSPAAPQPVNLPLTG